MDLYAIVFRVLFAYGFLLILVRISGKRSIYQGTAVDFVVALILGDMVDDLLWGEVPASQFVVSAGVIVGTHILISLAVCHSPAFQRLVQGTPRRVLRDGALLWEPLRRERLTEISVLGSLRAHEVEDLRKLEWAKVEYSGQISTGKRPWAGEARKEDSERVREAAR